MQGKRRLLTMLGAMCGASVLAWKVSPPPKIDLNALIPSSFGEWNVAPQSTQTVIPQTQALLDKRLIELKLALTGTIPDGMLFRVSSIEANTEQGCAQQESFVRALIASMKPEDRARVAGLQG